MAVAADELELTPGLDEARALAREHTLIPLRHTFIADCETPVSAYLKLRGGGPSFLLESAEQGQRFGRWSFLGFRPRAILTFRDGQVCADEYRFDRDTAERRSEPDVRRTLDAPDPFTAVSDYLAGYRVAPLEGL